LIEDELRRAAERLAGASIDEVVPAAAGGNNPTKVVQYFREIRPLNLLNHRETTR